MEEGTTSTTSPLATTTRERFGKVLTEDDISTGQLTISNYDAARYLPRIVKYDSQGNPLIGEGIMLPLLEKKKNELWEFRYCICTKNRTYALTTNWDKFVKSRALKHKDVIKFYECEETWEEITREYFMIEIEESAKKEKGADDKGLKEVNKWLYGLCTRP